ncbi:hypothetical protein BDD12DRAFT_845108 [Trichophaea hybrida]|nr:hypothetical protein BDD12DRAFT_845108 [Trichophaea hybrida]
MRLPIQLLFLAAVTFLEVSAVPAAEADADAAATLVRREPDKTIKKRACVTNGCTCRVGTSPGLYCWECTAVTYGGDSSVHSGNVKDWVFQCNSNGGCCAYGVRDSCKNLGTNPCG